jgi:hypothetical protein
MSVIFTVRTGVSQHPKLEQRTFRFIRCRKLCLSAPPSHCKITTRELDRLMRIALDTALAQPCVHSSPFESPVHPPLLNAISRVPNGPA